jgi:hypothetical protein
MTLLMLLVSHDVVMATDPHNVEAHGSRGSHVSMTHGPGPHAPSSELASHAQTAVCMALEAARTGETVHTDGEQGATVLMEPRWVAAEFGAVTADHNEPGISAGQRRAMLQVYLN